MQGLLAVGLLAGPIVANAVEVQTTTGNYVTFRDCIPTSAGACGYLSPIVYGEYGGEPGALTASANITSGTYGTATSDTSLSGEIGAPVLMTSAYAEAGARVNTNSFALQRYTYTGTEATTRTFGGTLDYVQSITDPNNANYDPGYHAGVNVGLVVFTSLDEFVEAGSTAESNYWNTYYFANGAATGYSALGDDWFHDYFDAAAGTATLGVTVNLNPGDSVWVWAFLQTPAYDGSYVDASHTFVTRWDNGAGLVAANSVPEPGTLALLGLGLAGLGLSRRRRAN